MEDVGAGAMFSSGDGDTTSYKDVDAKPFEEYDVVPVKLESVGHVHERLEHRLR